MFPIETFLRSAASPQHSLGSVGKTVVKTVFQTDGKRFCRAKAAMKERLRRMIVEQQARAINPILRGHFNYYGALRGTRRSSMRFGTSPGGSGNTLAENGARRAG